MEKGIEGKEDNRGRSGKTPFVNFQFSFFHSLCFLCIFLIGPNLPVLGRMGQLVLLIIFNIIIRAAKNSIKP